MDSIPDPSVTLREFTDDDLDANFAITRVPEAVRMAAFTAADPDDRGEYDAHMARIRASEFVLLRAIEVDGALAGTIASFMVEGDTEVTYWLDREVWGRGIAGRALAQLLALQPVRPLFARVATDNAGSMRVLQRAGFRIVGTEVAYANARGREIEETLLRLDAV